MSKAMRSTRANIQAAGGMSGILRVFDIATGRFFNIRGAIGTYHHIDVQAETKADWDIIVSITGGNPRNRSWPVRRVLVQAKNGTWFACGLFTYNHAPVVYKNSYNPGPGAEAHFCLHLYFTVSENKNPGSPDQYRRGHEACKAAENATPPSSSGQSSGTPAPTPVSTVNYQAEVISGPINIRRGAGTNTAIVRDGIRNPRRFFIDREQQGPDNNTSGIWCRIAKDDDKALNGCWIAKRLLRQIQTGAATAQPVSTQPAGLRIQVSAGNDKAWTDKLVAELKSKGFDAYYAFYGGLHRAQVGRNLTRPAAEKLAAKLGEQGYETFIKQ